MNNTCLLSCIQTLLLFLSHYTFCFWGFLSPVILTQTLIFGMQKCCWKKCVCATWDWFCGLILEVQKQQAAKPREFSYAKHKIFVKIALLAYKTNSVNPDLKLWGRGQQTMQHMPQSTCVYKLGFIGTQPCPYTLRGRWLIWHCRKSTEWSQGEPYGTKA